MSPHLVVAVYPQSVVVVPQSSRGPYFRVNPRFARPDIAAHVHPHSSADREQNCNDLSDRQSTGEDAIVFRPEELDDEPLDSRQHAVKPEQPSFGMLVVAVAPQ